MKKRRYKKKAIPVRIGETAPKERQQHQGGLISEVIDRMPNGKAILQRMRAKAECVLDYYLLRDDLTIEQHRAGAKFRKAYLRSVFKVKIDDCSTGCQSDPEQAALTPTAAEEAIRHAYQALGLNEQAVIRAVCGHDEWVGGLHRMNILKTGLTKLSDIL